VRKLGLGPSNDSCTQLTWVWTSVLCSNLIRHFTASLSRMRRRLATSRDTFCNAPAAEPQTHGWLWWRSRMSHFIPPLRRMMRIESTSELTLCKAPTALAFTCITPHVNKTRASTRRERIIYAAGMMLK
jgi:hypothetical protein